LEVNQSVEFRVNDFKSLATLGGLGLDIIHPRGARDNRADEGKAESNPWQPCV
jgi:hypothetical protein